MTAAKQPVWDVVALGEALVEFNQTRPGEPQYLQGFGGDTSNAVIAAARAGAAGLNEAPFHPADGWTEDENGEEREGVYGERQCMPLFSVFSELPEVFGYEAGNYAYRLPGPLAAAQAADAEAQAKAKAREDKAAAKAARAAQRAAKKTAPAAEPEPQRPRLGRPAPPALPERPAPLPPTPQQLLPEQPVPVASPFGAGPSES